MPDRLREREKESYCRLAVDLGDCKFSAEKVQSRLQRSINSRPCTRISLCTSRYISKRLCTLMSFSLGRASNDFGSPSFDVLVDAVKGRHELPKIFTTYQPRFITLSPYFLHSEIAERHQL